MDTDNFTLISYLHGHHNVTGSLCRVTFWDLSKVARGESDKAVAIDSLMDRMHKYSVSKAASTTNPLDLAYLGGIRSLEQPPKYHWKANTVIPVDDGSILAISLMASRHGRIVINNLFPLRIRANAPLIRVASNPPFVKGIEVLCDTDTRTLERPCLTHFIGRADPVDIAELEDYLDGDGDKLFGLPMQEAMFNALRSIDVDEIPINFDVRELLEGEGPPLSTEVFTPSGVKEVEIPSRPVRKIIFGNPSLTKKPK